MDIVKTLISDSYPLVILIIVCMIFFFPGRIDIFLSVLKRHINKISKEGVLFCSVNEPHDNTPPIARSLDKKEEEIYDELAKNYLENDVGCKIFATLWKHQIALDKTFYRRWAFLIQDSFAEIGIIKFIIPKLFFIGLLSRTKESHIFLTDFGIRFCQKFEKQLGGQTFI